VILTTALPCRKYAQGYTTR